MSHEVEPVETSAKLDNSNATLDRGYEVAIFDPDLDFGKLVSEGRRYYARGFTLVNKSDLENVPHVVIAVTYRPGYKKEDGSQSDYVSVEAVVADQRTLTSNPIRHRLPDEMRVFPEEPVIYNDGGTGIRRVLTQMFHTIGVIDVGPTRSINENPFDKPMFDWARGIETAKTGIVADLDGEVLRYVASRGLRKSEYDSPFGPATTWYYG